MVLMINIPKPGRVHTAVNKSTPSCNPDKENKPCLCSLPWPGINYKQAKGEGNKTVWCTYICFAQS